MLLRYDIAEFSNDVKDWATSTRNDLKSSISSLGIKRYPYSRNPVPLPQAIKSYVSEKFGIPSKVSYKMPRSAVFVHKGVSRGHGKNNPRKAKEWFNPVIENNIDKLGDIVANATGNMIINSINIK